MKNRDAYLALRIPPFRQLLTMRLLVTFSIQIMAVSVGYFIYDVTNSPFMLGLIGLTEALPSIGVSLYAGHIADKFSRQKILSICILVLFVCALTLLCLVFFRDKIPPALLVTGIFCVIFCTGIARGFFSPTYFAYMPQLVEKSALSNAITWNSSAWKTADITGLGVGGLLYGFIGVSATFAVMSVLLLLAFFLLLRIKPRPIPHAVITETAIKRIGDGLRFVFSNKLIISSIAMDLFAVLFGGAVALLPVFAKDILKVGPQGLGILRAAMSVGALLTTFLLAHYPMGKGAGKIMLYCVAGFGLCIIGFGMSANFYISFALLFLAGMLDEISVFIRSALVQFQTPDHMKGRVSSVNSIFITSSNEIGAFESGLAASLMGTVPAVVFGGCMTLVVVAITWKKAPKLRDFSF